MNTGENVGTIITRIFIPTTEDGDLMLHHLTPAKIRRLSDRRLVDYYHDALEWIDTEGWEYNSDEVEAILIQLLDEMDKRTDPRPWWKRLWDRLR